MDLNKFLSKLNTNFDSLPINENVQSDEKEMIGPSFDVSLLDKKPSSNKNVVQEIFQNLDENTKMAWEAKEVNNQTHSELKEYISEVIEQKLNQYLKNKIILQESGDEIIFFKVGKHIFRGTMQLVE